jgi:hypothetical protein
MTPRDTVAKIRAIAVREGLKGRREERMSCFELVVDELMDASLSILAFFRYSFFS